MTHSILPGAFSKSFFPIPQRLERKKRHTSIGFESMQKQFSPPSISAAILSRIVLQRDEVILRLSLYCVLSAGYKIGNFNLILL